MEGGKIRPIEKSTIHRICSGQVVLDLSMAVKELVENSLDAGATNIEVKLKEFGCEAVEVGDNGSGISPENYEGLCLKYHTSKIAGFNDLQTLSSFGFRGEALSSLCALSDLHVITCAKGQSVGVRIDYDSNGHIKRKVPAPRGQGTTVVLTGLFSPLPVRRKEFLRNLKREYGKLILLLQGYAIIASGVRIICSNQTGKAPRTTAIHTQGTAGMKNNIVTVFGVKAAACLQPLDVVSAHGCRVVGFISKIDSGCGRTAGDRQYFYLNGRPVDMPKVAKMLNELYRSFSSVGGSQATHFPMAFLDFQMPTDSYDVNVTPDKRKVFLHAESDIIAGLRDALMATFEPSRYTYTLGAGNEDSKGAATRGTPGGLSKRKRGQEGWDSDKESEEDASGAEEGDEESEEEEEEEDEDQDVKGKKKGRGSNGKAAIPSGSKKGGRGAVPSEMVRRGGPADAEEGEEGDEEEEEEESSDRTQAVRAAAAERIPRDSGAAKLRVARAAKARLEKEGCVSGDDHEEEGKEQDNEDVADLPLTDTLVTTRETPVVDIGLSHFARGDKPPGPSGPALRVSRVAAAMGAAAAAFSGAQGTTQAGNAAALAGGDGGAFAALKGSQKGLERMAVQQQQQRVGAGGPTGRQPSMAEFLTGFRKDAGAGRRGGGEAAAGGICAKSARKGRVAGRWVMAGDRGAVSMDDGDGNGHGNGGSDSDGDADDRGRDHGDSCTNGRGDRDGTDVVRLGTDASRRGKGGAGGAESRRWGAEAMLVDSADEEVDENVRALNAAQRGVLGREDNQGVEMDGCPAMDSGEAAPMVDAGEGNTSRSRRGIVSRSEETAMTAEDTSGAVRGQGAMTKGTADLLSREGAGGGRQQPPPGDGSNVSQGQEPREPFLGQLQSLHGAVSVGFVREKASEGWVGSGTALGVARGADAAEADTVTDSLNTEEGSLADMDAEAGAEGGVGGERGRRLWGLHSDGARVVAGGRAVIDLDKLADDEAAPPGIVPRDDGDGGRGEAAPARGGQGEERGGQGQGQGREEEYEHERCSMAFDLRQVRARAMARARRDKELAAGGGAKVGSRRGSSSTGAGTRPSRFRQASLALAPSRDVDGDNGGAGGGGGVGEEGEDAATRELEQVFQKEDFLHMKIVGQFNLGFIIAKLRDNMFIIDQHASDEKYNFERLAQSTVLNQQPLIRPLPIELSPAEELLLKANMHTFRANGFQFVELPAPSAGGEEPTGRSQLCLTSVPYSKNTVFGVADVQELLALLHDNCDETNPVMAHYHRTADQAERRRGLGSTNAHASGSIDVTDHQLDESRRWDPPGDHVQESGVEESRSPQGGAQLGADASADDGAGSGHQQGRSGGDDFDRQNGDDGQDSQNGQNGKGGGESRVVLPQATIAGTRVAVRPMKSPWNCPHGRPTMRHLVDLEALTQKCAVEHVDDIHRRHMA
eukprot:jgi/Mesvir1/26066/Mv06792-RA.1